ncbi:MULTISPECIES: hypothetical protein [Sporosarcina]|uniref:Uncharacterized protein n=1 Tax=Sporosarcina contaminans TaxID=633403 RepID=A0ABW3TVM7_9BACL
MPSTQSKWYIKLGCLSPIIGILALIYLLNQQIYLPGYIIFFIFFGLAVLFLYLSNQSEEKEKKKQIDHLQSIVPKDTSYVESHAFISYDLLSKIAVDEKKRRIYFWSPVQSGQAPVKRAYLNMPYDISSYRYENLLAIEIYENGMLQKGAINQNEKTGEKITALGQTIDHQQQSFSKLRKVIHRKVSTLEMKIIIDDAKQPVRVIRFYSNIDKRLKKDSSEYIAIKKEADHWLHLLTFLMEQSE